MAQINPNINNLFLKKQVNPSFKADKSAQIPEMQYEDLPQYDEQNYQENSVYYPDDSYSEPLDAQYPSNYYLPYDTDLEYPSMYPPTPKKQEKVDNEDYLLPEIYQGTALPEQKSAIDRLKNDPTGMIGNWFTNPLLMLATCFGLSKGVDAYNNACVGEYEKTLLGKATRMGDRLEESAFAQSKPVQTVVGGVKKGWQKTSDFLNKSDLIRSIRETPSLPEWPSAKHDIIAQEVRVIEDFNLITEKLKLTNDAPIEFKFLGIDNSERKMLKKLFGVNNISKIPEEMAVNVTLLKRLGKSDNEIMSIVGSGNSTSLVKAEILKTLELSADDIEKIRLNPEKYVEQVKEATKKAGNKVRIGMDYHKFLGPVQPTARTVSCDQVANKILSLKIGEGPKTATGKAFSNFVQKIHRGVTFGGGKLGIYIFIAPFLVTALKNTKKADPDQKVGTFANGLIESISWVFTFPLAIKTIYALGGMKYAGMSKEDVEKYRSLLNDFNKKADAKEFTSKLDYKNAKKALKKELKTLKNKNNGNLSLFSKIMKKIQGGMQLDLERIKHFQTDDMAKNVVNKIPNFLRDCAGVPLRVIITGFVIETAYRELLMKGIKAVFGNHYNEEQEMEQKDLAKQQKQAFKDDLQKRMVEIQKSKLEGADAKNNVEFAIPENMSKNIAEAQEAKKAMRQKDNPVNWEDVNSENHNLLEENKLIEDEVLNALEEKNSVTEQDVDKNVQQKTATNMIEQEVEKYKSQEGVNKEGVNEEGVNEEGVNEAKVEVVKDPKTVIEGETKIADNVDNVINPTTTVIPAVAGGATITGATGAGFVQQTIKNVETKPLIDNYTYLPSQNVGKDVLESAKTNKRDNYTYIPSSENVIKSDKEQNEHKYIPSQRGAKFTKTFDNSGLEKALQRADRAEQRAIEILAGNFPN